MVSSEASADETPNSVAEKPDELISKHEAVTKVVEDTASCKKTIKEVSEKPPKRKITHDMVLEEQYKALLLFFNLSIKDLIQLIGNLNLIGD